MSLPCYACNTKKVELAGDVCAGCREEGHRPIKLPGYKAEDFKPGVNRLDILQNNIDLLESQQRLLRRQMQVKDLPLPLQLLLTKTLVEISRVLPNIGKEAREAEKEHQQDIEEMGYEAFSDLILEAFSVWATSQQREFIEKIMLLWEKASNSKSLS